jgi:hypothetical protein
VSRSLRTITVLVAIAASVALAFAVRPALSGGHGAPPGLPVVASVRQLTALQRADGRVASIWRGQAADGRFCVFVQVRPAAQANVFDPDSGSAACTDNDPASDPKQPPIQAGVDWTLNSAGRYDVLISGRVSETQGIASASLDTSGPPNATRSQPLALGTDGYFLADLPSVTKAGQLPPSAPSAKIVGYDSTGVAVATFDLNALIARTTQHG